MTKEKTPRRTSKHPLLIGREPGVWHADLVGQVPGYAATEAGFKRRQEAARRQAQKLNATGRRGSRKGVPDGYAGRRTEVQAIREASQEAAKDVILALTNTTDAPLRRAVTKEDLAVAFDPTVKDRDRIRALTRILGLRTQPPRPKLQPTTESK